jgi:hypothetical protein
MFGVADLLRVWCDISIMDAYLRSIPGSQAKKPNADLSKVTHKVFFDIEIDGKPAGTLIFRSGRCTIFRARRTIQNSAVYTYYFADSCPSLGA